MKVLASGTAACVAVVLAMGCSSGSDAASSQAQPVQGGTVDTTHSYAVAVVTTTGLLCSGALIAPNLVMTARHCVDQSPSQIDCTSASTVFGAQHTATSNFYVTTYYQTNQNTQGWHQARKIFTTPGTAVCGNDMALIELTDNVSLSEAGGAFVTPVVQYSITDHTRYSTSVTAIGFGNTSATTQDAGTRHILENISLACIPGDSTIDCPSQVMSQLSPNEFISGDSTCEGDSGSSAYEQKNFNKNIPVSFGVLSRGGAQGSTCVEPIYTRTDSWKDFIIQTALTAASDGGYTPPAWTSAAPPPTTDGGTGTDSGGTQSDGAAPPPAGSLGATCADNSDCDSGVCLSDDGGKTYVCSAQCDPTKNGSDCAVANDQCVDDGTGTNTGYCFPAPQTSGFSDSNGGGCSVGTSDPSKPVPWGTVTLGAAYLAVALIRSRRRRD